MNVQVFSRNTILAGKEYGVSRTDWRVAPAGMLRLFHFVSVPEAREGVISPTADYPAAARCRPRAKGGDKKKPYSQEGVRRQPHGLTESGGTPENDPQPCGVAAGTRAPWARGGHFKGKIKSTILAGGSTAAMPPHGLPESGAPKKWSLLLGGKSAQKSRALWAKGDHF